MIALLFAAAVFTGNQRSAVQITFPNEAGVKSVEVVWDKSKVPAFRAQDLWTTIVGVDLDAKPGEHKTDVLLIMDDGRVDTRTISVKVIAKKYPTTQLKVEDKYVELSKADLERA